VLDTFAGSGTLAVAAIQTGRRFILFELQDKYVKVCQDRISQCGGERQEISNYTAENRLL
jgi:DNA modification methylase